MQLVSTGLGKPSIIITIITTRIVIRQCACDSPQSWPMPTIIIITITTIIVIISPLQSTSEPLASSLMLALWH
jgi:hypothetical protein